MGKKAAVLTLVPKNGRRADAAVGPPPADLSVHGRRLWQDIAAHAPWLTPADRETFKSYVAALMDRDVARSAQEKHEAECHRTGQNPLIIITKHGAQASPYIAMARRSAAEALKHATALGLTFRSRAKTVKLGKQDLLDEEYIRKLAADARRFDDDEG